MATQLLSTAAFLRPGELIADRYEVVRVLGSGSLGWVIEAKDSSLDGERVALKILYPHLLANEQIVQRVQNEVLIARQLSHPNIIRIFDFDTSDEGVCFIAMEFIDGGTLRDVMQSAKAATLPFDSAVKALYYVAKALAHAHQKGVVHRDLNPDNVLVSRDGEIKISDFGIARSLEFERGLTITGETVGTPGYMAPEQFSAGDSTECSDIYSFGIIAWELVHGAPPFEGDSYYTVARQHIEAAIPKKDDEEALIPKWFSELIASCTRKRPEDRIESADELVKLIRAYQGERLESRPLSVVLRKPRSGKEYLRFAGWLTLVFLFIGTLALWNSLQTKTRLQYGAFYLRAEKHIGWEFDMMKSLLSIHGSLLDPYSAVTLIRGNDAEGEWSISLRALLDAGLDPNLLLDNGETLLHDAIRWGSAEAVRILLAYKASIDSVNNEGQTPLELAVLLSEPEKVMHLINAGAPYDALDTEGQTLLHTAILNADYFVTNALLSSGASQSRKSARGLYPIQTAATVPHPRIINLLLRYGADPNTRGLHGRSALHYLSEAEQIPKSLATAKVLIEHGADLWVLSNNGHLPYVEALLNRRGELAALLLEHTLSISPPRWVIDTQLSSILRNE